MVTAAPPPASPPAPRIVQAAHLQAVVAGGALGELRSAHAEVLIPWWVFGGANIRFQETLAGGWREGGRDEGGRRGRWQRHGTAWRGVAWHVHT